ncbi:MAG: sulfatase-like hydrolase/transferase, partial [Vicinamibacteraceae bacterium]|nr:sulfatase-like hydrolase/transferase [Vicinamibacteraceae bacterium]
MVDRAGSSSPSSWWRRDWWAAAAVAAAVVTLLDAALLQRKNNYFTGGFLTVEHLRSVTEAVVFLAGLWLTNLGLTGPVAALTLWLARMWRYSTSARLLVATSVAALPLVVADIVSYRILEYLGSAFDFGLMFDLAGRSPAEIAAVAGAHILQLFALVGLGLVGLLVVAWALHRWRPQGRQPAPPGRPARAFWWRRSLVLLVVALVVSTGLRVASATFDNGLKRTPAGEAFGTVVSWGTDVDRDGYGLLSTPRDPAPFDARIHPWAVDWPGNGIDENGIAGDLPADFPAYVEGASEPPRFVHRPAVVLVVLESFRADMVGASLDGRPVTPVLDELARRGFSSERAYSHNGYTVQSRFHLFSGSLADLRGGTTLIDDFKANGYQVAYFSAQDESFGGDAMSVGYGRADVFYDARQDRGNRYTKFATPGSLAVPATVLRERVRAFLAERTDTRPLFLYVNFHDTHFPYHHRLIEPLISEVVVPQGQIAPARADDLRRMYMNTAANVDREIGRVLDDVRKALGEEPAVIVTSDHGE